ncbi:MAG: ribulose-phosphate 3-epimerase [Actinomycetota bacterium]
MPARIAPSILSADFANLERDLASISDADLIHVDVMDGHFVPNLTIGLPVVKRINEVAKVPLDVHLMIENPELWVGEYAATGAHSITFHLEATKNPIEVIEKITSAGSKVAIALKPGTPIVQVAEFLPKIDMLLVMTVEPGFGGQSLIPETVAKISEARSLANKLAPKLSIQVDGGITLENISELSDAGADTFVAGTAVFEASNRNQRIGELRLQAGNL